MEYHVTPGTAGHLDRPSCLVPGIDPPAAGGFGRAVAAARLVREALSGAGLAGAVKTSGAKGAHVCVPVREPVPADDAAAAAACSPRARPGVPVSFPLAWDWLDGVSPGDFTVRNAARLLAGADPRAAALPPPRELPEDLIAQGHTIPVARVQAMHEGKRRARAQRGSSHAGG